MVKCAGCGNIISISMTPGQLYSCSKSGKGFQYDPVRDGVPLTPPPIPKPKALSWMQRLKNWWST